MSRLSIILCVVLCGCHSAEPTMSPGEREVWKIRSCIGEANASYWPQGTPDWKRHYWTCRARQKGNTL